VYIYQGDELGLWEVEDIPLHLRQDPTLAQSGGADLGRDGCRVPIPWDGDAPPFGFSPADANAGPWLPQPAAWADHTVAAQAGDPGSVLELYRSALRIRRTEAALGDGPITWQPAADGVLAFSRGAEASFSCVVNLSDSPAELPDHAEVLLTSDPLDGGLLPPDTAAWLRSAG
jgi:alpha-glucosidase